MIRWAYAFIDQVCLDIPAAEYDAEVSFWARLTGWELQPSPPEFHRLKHPTGIPVQILLQRLDDDGEGGSSAHLDLDCVDADEERRRHEALGVTFIADFPEWIVMRDPAAGTYCLTRREPRG
ncbi:VOC family protein [Actinoplanes sp. TFC3]|uniref:VOC family protein n=1 Tax=Actinoplanes sp. TFC3 TaxID=1710355 RepID=UPI0008377E5D|nr:VOC family protein [Actinoplanes sp. TFC3]